MSASFWRNNRACTNDGIAARRRRRTARQSNLLMFLQLAMFAVFLCGDTCDARTSAELKVQLGHGGVLVGRHLTSHNGRDLRGFLGVPYAKPPIGERRFKAPEPFGAWSGEKLVIRDASKCVQRDPYRRDTLIEGSEDCLYLNVYTPADSKVQQRESPLPVMVWFHGGGWMCGAGISSFYGPDYLMDHDIVLVAANFRLGPLGFLSTETLDCPGNFGLKDQLEVLRWVQEHISRFGGDPDSVTIFGESAGGASVTYMMHSEQAKGLFHRGIAQSGTYLNGWAQPGHEGRAASRAHQMSAMLGCAEKIEENKRANKPNWPQVMACLRAKPAEEIVATLYNLFEWDNDPMIPFPPVIEPAHDGAFITASPRTLPPPHGLSLPLMIGITSEEGLLRTASLLNMPSHFTEFKERFHHLLPIILYYDHHSIEVQQQISEKIEKFYFKNGHDYSKANHQNLTDLISDGWFNAGIDEYLRLRLNHHNEHRMPSNMPPTYVYLFEQKAAASFTEIFKGGREEYYGACHAEELQYLFPVGRELFPSAIPTANDLKLREAMLSMWVNFANGSNPTPANSNLPTWQPTAAYPVHYARLGSKCESEWKLLQNDYGLYQDRMDFWDELQPFLPAKSNAKDEL